MLAYLFCHRPSDDVDDYERRLAEFHERLRADPPNGFAGSVSFKVDVPWVGKGWICALAAPARARPGARILRVDAG